MNAFRSSLSLLRAAPRATNTRFGPSILGSPSAANLLRTRLLTTEARAKIDSVVAENPLVLFMKGTPDLPQCGFSRAVCQILELHGVQDKVVAFNCLEDPELREGIKEYSSWPTIPQLYFKGEFLGGCDILISMHQNGELETMLVEAGLEPPRSAEEQTNA